MQQLKAFKFKLDPTEEQCILLNKTFGCVRFVWNQLVEDFNNWNPAIEHIKVTEKTLKDNPEYSWLNEVSAASLQQKRRDFDETKHQYFNKQRKKKLGRPKFKCKGVKESYRLPNQKFHLDQDIAKIRLEKIGDISIILDRIIPSDAIFKSVTISKDSIVHYYATILVQINIDLKPLTGRQVGIDLGLKHLLILSDGQVINNPKFFHKNQVELKKAQQHLSRKQKDSNRRRIQKFKVAKIHKTIKNQRTNFLHKVSTSLINNYDIIALEDLNVAGMTKNRKLAKAIQDSSWSSLVSMLEYKAAWYGKTIVKVERFYPSSKTCSYCGFKLDILPLSIREWTCPKCDSIHHRDLNAARNILQQGKSLLSGEPIQFEHLSKCSSVEYIEYRRGDGVSLNLFSNKHHLAPSVKRLENL